jgi:hypothetical protein
MASFNCDLAVHSLDALRCQSCRRCFTIVLSNEPTQGTITHPLFRFETPSVRRGNDRVA